MVERHRAIGNNLIVTNAIHHLSRLFIYSAQASCYSPAPGRSRKHHIVPQNKREIKMKYPQASLRMFLSKTVAFLLEVAVVIAGNQNQPIITRGGRRAGFLLVGGRGLGAAREGRERERAGVAWRAARKSDGVLPLQGEDVGARCVRKLVQHE